MFYEDTYAFLWSWSSRNSFGKPNSFPVTLRDPSPARLSRPVHPLPPIRPVAPFSRAFLNGGTVRARTYTCARTSVHGFLSSARCLRAAENTDGPVSGRNRDTGVSSISLCLGVGANNGGSMSLRLRRPNATVGLSPAFGDHANIYLPVLAGGTNNPAQQRRNSGQPASRDLFTRLSRQATPLTADFTFAIHSLRRSSPPTIIISVAKKRSRVAHAASVLFPRGTTFKDCSKASAVPNSGHVPEQIPRLACYLFESSGHPESRYTP
jgi:hypothetical protein